MEELLRLIPRQCNLVLAKLLIGKFRMEFFVEIDHETIRRIIVRTLSEHRFNVTMSLLCDEGYEIMVSMREVNGLPELAQLLLREGVPSGIVERELGLPLPPSWLSRHRTGFTTMMAALVTIGAIIMMIHE